MIFENIKEESKQKIVTAALREFAENGYNRASTNSIVKRAGVGKGMLYYYFKNKYELYVYLITQSLGVIEEHVNKQINLDETDFFERYRQTVDIEMKVYMENADFFNFMSYVFVMENDHLPNDLSDSIEQLKTEGFGSLYKNIDLTKFRDDIDVEKALQLIQWALDGYQQQLIERLKGTDFSNFEFEVYQKEFMEYLNVLKTSFYH
ncbi:TetR/AcrR family transcriptional regulator [Aquisalibacillus elongatus]|uniref:TetR family transcriptional regulator n=1 Tax=Aquisalibacillus elongatus TaxID=485577 RepID=A0A3N5C9P7_9BACI|nr:TetR/AcrR family transcriptional regulator [Aquisalibacillus elongatus]RPF53391.1 TetR family transcriptional regulator [Aquisalibacillus elongatus]